MTTEEQKIRAFIPYEEWREENHRILYAEVMHKARPSASAIDTCYLCGLALDRGTGLHISKYAREIAKKEGLPVMTVDWLVANGKYTIMDRRVRDE